jgi:hypothetical protein
MNKRTNNRFSAIFVIGILFLFSWGCTEDSNTAVTPKYAPVLTTTDITNITKTTATSGGSITSDGGSAVLTKGVCWSTGSVPTIADQKTIDTATGTTFISQLSSLEPKTTYSVRAYATNAIGTSYGNTVTFSTDSELVSTKETYKVALLEDFTGVRCGYCPDGHRVAKEILDANPGKFIIMAVHGGSYATPATGWANFTTSYANALINQAKVAGFPAGTMNRISAATLGVTPQLTGGYAMNRGDWPYAAAYVMAEIAPVNINATATFNSTNRLLTVNVYLYYTSDVSGSNNVNVALLQDKLYSKQSGGTPDPNNYEQNHVLRYFLTGMWGEVLTYAGETKGTMVSKTYTYTVPEDYNGTTVEGGGAVVVDNLNVVVFVANGRFNVLNAFAVDVK